MDISLFRIQLTRLNKRLRQEAQNHPESWSEMLVLSSIERLGEDATPSKIATAETMYSSNLAALLRKLEGSGLISRVPDKQDKRRVRLQLTEKGIFTLEESRRRRDEWLSKAIDTCLNEQEQSQLQELGSLLEKLANHQ